MRRVGRFVLGAAALACAGSTMAQNFNVDFNNTTGAGAGLPATGYTAAAGPELATTPWIGLNGAVGPQAMGGGVTLTWSSSIGLFGFAAPGLTGNDALLMNDILDLGSSTTNVRTATIAGLVNGLYEVYVYAWAPDSAAFLTAVNIAGQGAENIGGAWGGGAFIEGVTHAKKTVNVTNGTLSYTVVAASGFGSVNGFQLHLVPSPAGVALLGLAGLVSRRRRA